MSSPAPTAPDRTRPPALATPRPFHFPTYERRRLGGGPELVACRQSRVPLISFDLLVPAGAQFEPPEHSGLASLTAALLDEGTRHSTATEIAARTGRLGTSLATGADWHVGYVSLGVLSRYLDEALELLFEVATSATFPEEEVVRLRRERLAELLRRRDQPGIVAGEQLQRILYGVGTYGSPLVGTEEGVRSVDRERTLTYYRRHYSLAGATLIAVGDVDPDRLAARIEELRPDRAGPGAPESRPATPLPRKGVTVHLVDRPEAAQTELRLGQVAIPRLHPDFVPLAVINTLLGGKFTSRINLSLRERHGYTYGASSRLYARSGPGPLVIKTAVATEVAAAAAREVLAELERLRQEQVEDRELEATKNYLTGVFPYTLQSLDGIAQRLENLVVFGLPEGYYETYLSEIRAVEPAAVLDVARRRLHPDRIAVVAVGPAAELRGPFEELGLGPIEVLDL